MIFIPLADAAVIPDHRLFAMHFFLITTLIPVSAVI